MALSLLLFIGLGTSVVCAKPIDREKAKQIAQRQIQKKINIDKQWKKWNQI